MRPSLFDLALAALALAALALTAAAPPAAAQAAGPGGYGIDNPPVLLSHCAAVRSQACAKMCAKMLASHAQISTEQPMRCQMVKAAPAPRRLQPA